MKIADSCLWSWNSNSHAFMGIGEESVGIWISANCQTDSQTLIGCLKFGIPMRLASLINDRFGLSRIIGQNAVLLNEGRTESDSTT